VVLDAEGPKYVCHPHVRVGYPFAFSSTSSALVSIGLRSLGRSRGGPPASSGPRGGVCLSGLRNARAGYRPGVAGGQARYRLVTGTTTGFFRTSAE
jgi:hypothetical protein